MKPQYWLEERYLKDKLVHTDLHRTEPNAEIITNIRLTHTVVIIPLIRACNVCEDCCTTST